MAQLVPRYPSSVIKEIEASITGYREGSRDLELELIVRVDETMLNVRELAAYLSLADRVYGRAFELGIYSYAQRPAAQLTITEIRHGSLEFHFVDSLINYFREHPESLIFLYLFLRYGPTGLKDISETVKNLADSYKGVQEGKLAKINRKKVAEDMKNDEILRTLSESQRSDLRRVLRYFEAKEQRNLKPARRLGLKSVREIIIRYRRRQDHR